MHEPGICCLLSTVCRTQAGTWRPHKAGTGAACTSRGGGIPRDREAQVTGTPRAPPLPGKKGRPVGSSEGWKPKAAVTSLMEPSPGSTRSTHTLGEGAQSWGACPGLCWWPLAVPDGVSPPAPAPDTRGQCGSGSPHSTPSTSHLSG